MRARPAILCLAVCAVVSITHAHASSQTAWVTNLYNNTVTVIDTSSNTVAEIIPFPPTGNEVKHLAFSPDGSRVYVTLGNWNIQGYLCVVDVATQTIEAQIPVGIFAAGVAVSPDGAEIWVTNLQSNTLSVINAATNGVVFTIPGFAHPTFLQFSNDGKRVFVTNSQETDLVPGNVAVVDRASRGIIATVNVGRGCQYMALSPDGTTLYVANTATRVYSVIDTEALEVVGEVQVPTGIANAAVFSPDGSRVYAVNPPTNSVFIIDAATGSVLGSAKVGGGPAGIGVTADGRTLYVPCFSGNGVWVLETTTMGVVAVLPAPSPGVGVYDIALSPVQVEPFTVRLVDHTGAGLSGGAVKWNDDNWHFAGITGADGTLSFQPGEWSRICLNYHQATVCKVRGEPLVWQTVQATVRLVNHTGAAGLAGARVAQGGGFWDTSPGATDSQGNVYWEVFPNTSHKFRVSYNGASVTGTFRIGPSGGTARFQTGAVVSASGTCTQFAQDSWLPFVQNIELLPGTAWRFMFRDGTPITTYPVGAGLVNVIH